MAESSSEEYLKNFENYLKKRVNLLTKPFHPTVPIRKENRPTPEEVKLRVLQNPRFNNYLDKISTDKNDRDKKIFEALEILSEMGFDRSLMVIRALGSIIDKLMGQLYDAVNVNEKSVRELKKSMGHQQVIYLPSHRSYVDFMLMSYICFSYNLEIPCIAAGMDFHGMMGLGELLRKTGAFFMRRTFGDEFYWNIFKEYVHEIMTFNDLGLEFFVEGTRSRTMKALWPKTGLLTMALEPFFKGELYNLKIVPCSISYEKPLEEQLFVYELLGVPKPKESTSGFIKAVTALRDKKYGRMFFDYGISIDLNEYFGSKLNKFKYSSEPAHVQHLNGDELKMITNLAHHVVREQQKRIIIMIFNLLSLIYNESIFTRTSTNLTEVTNRVLEVMSIFEGLGAIVSVDRKNIIEEIKSTIAIHSNVMKINNNQLELIKAVTESSAKITNVDNLKSGHLLSSHVMNVAIPVFSLQLYCNPTLFWLAQPAFFILCTKDENYVTENELRNGVRKLREIFIYEFVMHSDFEEEDFKNTLNKLLKLKVILKDGDKFIWNVQSEFSNLLLSAISPFLSSFLFTSTILLDIFRNKQFTEKEAFKAIQSSLEIEIIKGNFSIHPYALCLETISTTLLSLCSQGCLSKEKKESKNFYAVIEENLQSLKDTLASYDRKMNFEFKYFSSVIQSKI